MKLGDIMPVINMKLYKDDNKYYDLNNINVFLEDEIIKFDIDGIKNIFDLRDYGCIFIRESDEFKFVLDTNEEVSTYHLKETDTLLDLKVERCNFKRKKNNIAIEYQLETDDCLNKIELEIVSI